MAADIAEQPAGYARLLDGEHAAAVAAIAARVAERRPRHVVFVGPRCTGHT
jgi:glucosamine--fructose-6-phosphate aminotransferase (isomerizing)